MRSHHTRRILWFLFGLGSQLQIIASLSFTELFVYGAAVALISSEYYHMRRNGVLPLFWISICLVANAALSCLVNGTHPALVLRGMAVVTLIPCTVVVGHWMLRKDMVNFKWMLVGVAISSVLCTFVFQQSVELSTWADGGGAHAAEDIMGGVLFWKSRISALVSAITKGWYMQLPIAFVLSAQLGFAAFSLLSTVSGRGTALCTIASAALVLLGGKNPERIKRAICRHFILLCLMAGALGLGVKTLYQVAVVNGWLGEAALHKYEVQTKGDTSVMGLLLGGRMEAFCGLLACRDRPLIGFGPWPLDEHGYINEFMAKYGTPEDYDKLIKEQKFEAARGNPIGMIPAHSAVTSFWVSYGIFGLIFWLYVTFVHIRYLRQDCYVVPQWFMWLAASIPGFLWDMLFNPFSARVGSVLFIVAVLLVRAVRRGTMPLPMEYLIQIQELKRKG